MESIHGITIQKLAEVMAKYGELKTQHGERVGEAEMDRYLASEGISGQAWAAAQNAWHQRFKVDGAAAAEFHKIEQKLTLKANFGDVRDMSGDKVHGVTLETYVKVMCLVQKEPDNYEAIVKQNGFRDGPHWTQVQSAWGTKMGEDTSGATAVQYGELFQKYGGQVNGMSVEENNAKAVAAAYADTSTPDEDEEEPEPMTQEEALSAVGSKKRSERWEAARTLAHNFEIGDVDEDPGLKDGLRKAVPVLIDIVEHHHEDAVSEVEAAARTLVDVGQRNSDNKMIFEMVLGRAKEHLQTLEDAFAPIANKQVPERVALQSKIQDHTSLCETLEELLEDWEDDASSEESLESAAPLDSLKKKAGGLLGRFLGR